MNIPEFSVKRPIFISMISCIVLILGGVALSYLPVDLMPDITYPGVTIITTYEDASPEEVEELISKRIERSLSARLRGEGDHLHLRRRFQQRDRLLQLGDRPRIGGGRRA